VFHTCLTNCVPGQVQVCGNDRIRQIGREGAPTKRKLQPTKRNLERNKMHGTLETTVGELDEANRARRCSHKTKSSTDKTKSGTKRNAWDTGNNGWRELDEAKFVAKLVAKVHLLPQELPRAHKRSPLLDFPPDNIGPLIDLQRQVSVASNPLCKIRVHRRF
jgi:hypothetical protein